MSAKTIGGSNGWNHAESERQDAIAWMAEHEEIFGVQKARCEVQEELRQNPELFREFMQWSDRWKEEFLEFCMGVRGMNITYDPVFKKIFNPEEHPERLTEFLSLCLGKKLEIVQVLPNESRRLTEEGSLLVMDILVKLETGALVNIEIQRLGYLFPGERCACYSSDLVMRQYVQVKNQKREEGKRFSYKDIKNVYTIVLIQKSTSEFQAVSDQYLHYSRQIFNTGLQLNMIQEYLLIPLDIFQKNNHNINSRLDGWLTFLSSDKPEDIRRLLEAYPEFAGFYREVFQFRYHIKELVRMFSKELSILDANTVQYMIEVQQEELERMKEEEKRQQEELRRVEEEKQRIEEEKQRIEEEKQRIEEEKQQIEEEKQRAEEEKQRIEEEREAALQEIARLKALLSERKA